jgi:hypothetical protein
MADLSYIRPNQLRQQVHNEHQWLLRLGIPIMVIAVIFGYVLFGLGLWLIVLAVFWRRNDQRLHGALGEDMALGQPQAYPGSLVGLPDTYTIYSQVRVPWKDSYREFDFIVVGPNGIFCIEIKHHRGHIRGSEADKNWRQKKRSRTGRLYENDMRNPVAQVKSAIYPLKQYLASHGANNWIQGVVVFTHPECELEIGETSIPVLTLKELAPYITRHRPLWPMQHRNIVVRALKVLRDWSEDMTRDRTMWQILTMAKNEVRLKPLVPQPIKNFMRDFVTAEERIQGTMNHDYKAAAKQQCRAKAAPLQSLAPVVVTPAPVRRKPPHMTVIQGGQRGNAKTVREVTLYVRRTETETTEEGDE